MVDASWPLADRDQEITQAELVAGDRKLVGLSMLRQGEEVSVKQVKGDRLKVMQTTVTT